MVPPGVYEALKRQAHTALSVGIPSKIATAGLDVIVSPHMEEPRDCPTCHGTGRLPLSETLAAQAYLGDRWARELVGDCVEMDVSESETHCLWCDDGNDLPLQSWASGLTRWPQVAVMAAVGAGREVRKGYECESCRECASRLEELEWQEEYPAQMHDQEWLEAADDPPDPILDDLRPKASDCVCVKIDAALDAAADWARNPSPEWREVWREAGTFGLQWLAIPSGDPAEALQAAARELCGPSGCGCHVGARPCDHRGEDFARTAATTHALTWLRGEE